ncbi:OmpA family protein [Rubrivivax sp. RP6-9]|uniref:OmpA family protein n=1 Tax=Rubrivivax sp. RP6-9 TaxID=3415750 RepID=UPI003CC67DEA
MTATHTGRLLALAGLGTLLAGTALGQDESHDYFGIAGGASQAKIDQPGITRRLGDSGLTVDGFTADNRDKAYRVFGGYQFNRHVGVEAGYFNLGRFGYSATTTPAGRLDGQIKLDGPHLDLVGTLPMTERLSFLARVGVHGARARDQFTGSGAVGVLNANPRKTEANYKLGAGLQYAFSPGFALRGELDRYRVNDAVGNKGDVDTVTVSLVFPFGRAAPPAPRMAAAPVDVAPPPPPPPPPVVAPPPPPPPVVVVPAPPPPPPPPERRRVSFEAESLFAFDQAAIKPEGRVALDKFAADTRGTSFEVVIVEGHTDRLGSDKYNQALSQRRADAVKDYLVSAGGFEAAKVSSVGKGETQPITKPGDCKGTQPTASLIACLQPDRRVEIDVSGTR